MLRRGVRLTDDPVRGVAALLYPEGVLLLNDTAAAVVRRCDGHRGVAAIVADLVGCYDGVDAASVHALVGDLVDRRLLAIGDVCGPRPWPVPHHSPAVADAPTDAGAAGSGPGRPAGRADLPVSAALHLLLESGTRPPAPPTS